MVHFMDDVLTLQNTCGYSRKVAVLITRILRGIDNLDILISHGVVKINEHYQIQQYFSMLD